MFNVGGGEILVIALIALIVLGPQRLPDAARQVGKAMGDLRRLSSGFQNELRSAFDESEQPTRTAPPRDPLGATPAASTAPAAEGPDEAPGSVAAPARPRRRAPLRAEPVPEAPPHRTNGS